eukprot:737606-Amphidinium_carterae.1
MLAALHSLHRSGQTELLGAKIGQFAKAIEVALLMQWHFAVAWQLTGIAEPLPHSALHAGLAHPTELSSSLAYLKEVKLMEEAAKRGGLPTTIEGEPSGSVGPDSGAKRNSKPQRGGGKGGGSSLVEIESEIMRYFEHRVVPRNPGRTNLLEKDADSAPRSLLLGLFTSRGLGVTRATSLVHELGRLRPSELVECGYWSAMINDLAEGSETPMHVDERNSGANIVHPLCASGHVVGGSFVLASSDGLSQECGHAVERTGCRRLSVTYFSPYRLDQVPDAVYQEARSHGFGELSGLPRCCLSIQWWMFRL